MVIKDEVWAAFWTRWGPGITRTARGAIHLVRVMLLVGLGLVGDVVLILNGLEYVLNHMVNGLEHLLDVLHH